MISSKTQIRFALLVVAFISLGTSLLSLSYLNRMGRKIEIIANRDAKIVELGEILSVKILEARREEKNFIIYFDTLYIQKNTEILKQIRKDVNNAKSFASAYVEKLDSIEILMTRYSQNIRLLVQTFEEDPRTLYKLQRQIINYEQELRSLATKQKLDIESLPTWTSDVNISMLSAATKLSAEKSKLFIELRETGNGITQLAQEISISARESLARNSVQGMSYSIKAQRNTITLLLIAGFLMAYLLYYLPRKIFLPYRKIGKALQAIGRGETEYKLPNIESRDELGDLSRSFQEAIRKLHFFNELKTAKITEIQRNLHRILEEVGEAVLILSPDLTLLYLNNAAKTLFDVSRDIVTQPLKELSALWEVLEESIIDIEKRGRFEVTLKVKRMDIRKKTVSIIPAVSNSGKLENILIVIR